MDAARPPGRPADGLRCAVRNGGHPSHRGRGRSPIAAGEDVEPYGDFNHEDKARSFLPRRFFWGGDHPKSGGVRMELDWTGAGAKAVLNGEQNVVSPSWILHKINKAFLGIKHNVGGLVPRSAFHSIQAFAKAGAGNHKPPIPMTEEEIQSAIAEGLKPINEQLTALAKLPAPAHNTNHPFQPFLQLFSTFSRGYTEPECCGSRIPGKMPAIAAGADPRGPQRVSSVLSANRLGTA